MVLFKQMAKLGMWPTSLNLRTSPWRTRTYLSRNVAVKGMWGKGSYHDITAHDMPNATYGKHHLCCQEAVSLRSHNSLRWQISLIEWATFCKSRFQMHRLERKCVCFESVQWHHWFSAAKTTNHDHEPIMAQFTDAYMCHHISMSWMFTLCTMKKGWI